MRLDQNPFYVLGVSPQQDRHTILSVAKERSLVVDEQSVRGAKSVLVHPVKRIAAEVAWLPGVDSDRIAGLFGLLELYPTRIRTYVQLGTYVQVPPLAQANLLSEALVQLPSNVPISELVQWTVSIATIYAKIDVESTIELLNADRRKSEFPTISNRGHVQSALRERRRYFRRTIETVLDRLSASKKVDALTAVVEECTHDNRRAPVVVDDLVDRYDDEQRPKLEEGVAQIAALCGEVLSCASEFLKQGGEVEVRLKDGTSRRMRFSDVMALLGGNRDAIRAPLRELIDAIYSWDQIAQPIQVSARSRGLRHDPSMRVAAMIRQLAISLHNEHGMSWASEELTGVLLKAFAEIDAVVEASRKDADTLARMIRKHKDRH